MNFAQNVSIVLQCVTSRLLMILTKTLITSFKSYDYSNTNLNFLKFRVLNIQILKYSYEFLTKSNFFKIKTPFKYPREYFKSRNLLSCL